MNERASIPNVVASDAHGRPVSRFTFEEISRKANEVRAIFERRGIKLHRDSSLGRLLRSASALTEAQDGGRNGGIQEILSASHANRIADAVMAMADEASAEQSFRRIAGNPMDLSSRTLSQGKDHLWELELCSFFRRRGVDAELVDPPDIVLRLKTESIPIACKKIYSVKGVEAQMKKGVKQIGAAGHGGIVAFNIDDLLPANALLKQRDSYQASERLGLIERQFIEEHRRRFEPYIRDGLCGGILVSAACVCDLEEGGPRFTAVADSTFWTLDRLTPLAQRHVDAMRAIVF